VSWPVAGVVVVLILALLILYGVKAESCTRHGGRFVVSPGGGWLCVREDGRVR
jgi:hypothetical protein